jgi:hypothetical protein
MLAMMLPAGRVSFKWLCLGSLDNLSGTALRWRYAGIQGKLREGGGLLADIFAHASQLFN